VPPSGAEPFRASRRIRRSWKPGGTAARVHYAGAEVHLTRTEFDLLDVMADRPGSVFSRGELLEQIWAWADAAPTRAVDSQIKALRRKIGAEMIRTVHGVGYALEVPE
jgi:DNA-binding response OmpR family regulator